VGAAGFEPATPSSRTRCSTRLSHAPISLVRPYIALPCGGRKHVGRTRQVASIAGIFALGMLVPGCYVALRPTPRGRSAGRSRSRIDSMANETLRLAEYAAQLRIEDVPADVIQRARDTIIDTVGTIVFGYDLPWSRIIVAHA